MAEYETGVTIIAGTGHIIGMDLNATVEEVLHGRSPEIGETLQLIVISKTPILSGSLVADISYEAYLDAGDADLAFIYPDTIEQENYWNRVYVQFVEGGLLGASTWTNPPREMFLGTAENEGPPLVGVWALSCVEEGLLQCVSGAGIPI